MCSPISKTTIYWLNICPIFIRLGYPELFVLIAIKLRILFMHSVISKAWKNPLPPHVTCFIPIKLNKIFLLSKQYLFHYLIPTLSHLEINKTGTLCSFLSRETDVQGLSLVLWPWACKEKTRKVPWILHEDQCTGMAWCFSFHRITHWWKPKQFHSSKKKKN